MKRRLAFAALVIAIAFASSGAHADEPRTDEATAQVLFDEAKALSVAGRWAAACPKLEESLRLAPGIGTKFNLADCYEHTGKLASAWAAFIDVAGLTRAKGQYDREQVARARAAALEPRLSRLVVIVPPASRTPGLVVKRDGVAIGEAAWGVPVPVDAGAHEIAATADGRAPWQATIAVEGEGKTEHIEVPPLTTPSPTATASPTATETTSTSTSTATSTQRTSAWILGGAGVVALGVGAFFGLHSLAKRDDAQPHCTADACDPSGIALRDQALGAGDASTVAFVIGAAAITGAVILYLTSPSPTSPQLRASIGPTRATLGLSW